MGKVEIPDTISVDLGKTYGVIFVGYMSANDLYNWDNPPQEIVRSKDGSVTVKTDPIARKRFVFDCIARCCTSAESIVIDADFIATLPGPKYKKIYAAFRQINELDDQAETPEEAEARNREEVGKLPVTA